MPCYVREHDKLMMENLDDLRICKETGLMHLCGRFCRLKVATPEGYFICPLTGFSSRLTPGLFEARPNTKNYASGEQIHWQQWTNGPRSSRNRTSVTNISADSIALNKGLFVNSGFSKLLTSNRSSLNDIHTKTSEIKNYKELYMLQAVEKVCVTPTAFDYFSSLALPIRCKRSCPRSASRTSLRCARARSTRRLAQRSIAWT